MRPPRLALALLVLGGVAPSPDATGREIGDEAAASPRFALQATLVPLQRSDDGRYALSAQARVAPGARDGDARFTLRPVGAPGATCEPFVDSLFANGFESP